MRTCSLCLALLLLTPTLLAAQAGEGGDDVWRALVRATLSGDSHTSTPEGYVVYSGVALEAALGRRLGDVFALELSVRTESREVDGPAGGGEALGSLEMIPANLVLQWRPRGWSGEVFLPYAGLGLNMSAVWEKSGALDTTEPPIALGPVGQIGADVSVSSRMALSFDVKWYPLDIDIEGLADPVPTVEVDPLSLGIGVSFVF